MFEISGIAMSDAVADLQEKPAKSGKGPLILAVILALAGGAGGFFAARSGLIPTGKHADEADQMQGGSHGDIKPALGDSHAEKANHGDLGILDNLPVAIEDIAFVPVDPITISLNSNQAVQHLRFRAQLEVNAEHRRDVMAVLPRVTDVMNSYLRALELGDLTGPLALARLRAQLLRRVQVATGKGQVRDLLIMEFVLN